jgi:AcrR family transcriptional regulator
MSTSFAAAPVETRRQQGDATRRRLLDQAARLFAAEGFHGVSLAQIAGACGLGNAGLLHHFPSKNKLYRAVLEALATDLEQRLAEASAAADVTPAARLRATLRAQAIWTARQPQAARLVLRELLDNLGRVEQAQNLPLSGVVALMRRQIEAAQAAGAVSPAPAMLLLTQFLGALAYAVMARPTFARMYPTDSLLGAEADWIAAVARTAEHTLLPGD